MNGDEPPLSSQRGLKGRLERASESPEAKFAARIGGPILLALLGFLGLQVWSDIREQGRAIGDIRQSMEVVVGRINLQDWRLDRLEQDQASAAKRPGPGNP
jgi:hypothetical protein